MTSEDTEWTVRPEIFLATYTKVSGDSYRKDVQVRAVQVNERLSVVTLEGDASANPGDWLVLNPTGEVWPVGGEKFGRHYQAAKGRLGRHREGRPSEEHGQS